MIVKLRVTLWWKLLFVLSLTLSLLLGQFSVINAQTPEPSQLVQQGITEYKNQQYQEAIALWNQALTTYREIKDLNSTTIVLKNLARAYQKIGVADLAVVLLKKKSSEIKLN